MSEDNLIDPETVAAMLRMKPATLINWRSRGKGPAFVKKGRFVYYEREVVEEFDRCRTVKAKSNAQYRELLREQSKGL